MSTIFSKIIAREIPAQFVYEDDTCVVIMDKFPVVDGQTLVISKQEVDYIFDLSEETYNHLFKVASKVAKASDEAFATLRTCLVVEGFEVPHVHIKLYPVANGSNLGEIITKPQSKTDDELEAAAEKIRVKLNPKDQ
jgi:histidine triad (HIT) family protein